MAPDPLYPNFDPDFFGRVAKISAVVSVLILIATVAALILVTPDPGKCPGWRMPDPSGTPALMIVSIFVGLPVIWICYVAWHADWFARRFVDALRDSEGSYSFPSVIFPANLLIATVMAGWSLFCAFPGIMILRSCTSLLPF